MKKKILKISILVILIIILTDLIYVFYFTSKVTAVLPPIKKYEYKGNIVRLIVGIRKYASVNSNITFQITDTTGSKLDGYAIYMSIVAKNIEYDLKCEEQDSEGKFGNTAISLVGVYDKARNKGGYTKEAEGISAFVDKFNFDILKPLRDTQNIQIKVL